jgi:Domain of unknown function (DUF4159)
MTEPSPTKDKHWTEKISRSGYFLGAVLLHLVVFILVAAIVVFPPFHPEETNFGRAPLPAPISPSPAPPKAPDNPNVDVASHNPIPTPTPILTQDGEPAVHIPVPHVTPGDIDSNLSPGEKIKMTRTVIAPKGLSPERIKGIQRMLENAGRSPEDIAHSDGNPRNIKAKFVVYVASYADGDWSCNSVLEDGKIKAGSLPNLLAKVGEWSHGQITAEVVPTPLNIGSSELIDKMPPFIFFTGHKAFRLTDQEVVNLREYLQMGGAIWGDNALAGQGSRFDLAFRNEMKRVVPDKDKNFQPFDASDDVFKSWFPLAQLPSGMNFYHEPIEHLDIDGRLAILYTPNDYSDMLAMRILPGDETVEDVQPDPKSGSPLVTNATFYWNRKVYFRNFSLPQCLACDQLGMNIIGYFLTRFDNDLLLSTH